MERPERSDAMSAPQTQAAWLLRRWDRIGIGVRCAYNPGCACAVRHYLEAGRRVVASGARTEPLVQRRILTVLLQTAHDEALPWFWRSVCLEHSAYPLARLHSLLSANDPIALHAMDCAVQAAHDGLAATPPRLERGA
jgi:hypothetical protein